jgi:hypothetical protein
MLSNEQVALLHISFFVENAARRLRSFPDTACAGPFRLLVAKRACARDA